MHGTMTEPRATHESSLAWKRGGIKNMAKTFEVRGSHGCIERSAERKNHRNYKGAKITKMDGGTE